jgi:8-oxo-dGTP pyrophosphatase MutT (NUDIX family)
VTKNLHDVVVVDTPHWVNVVALTSEDQVVLVRQFRHGRESVTLEIPGGMVDVGESPLLAGQRELREETGYCSQHWIELGVVEPNPAFQTNLCWTYLALDVQRDSEIALDPGEVIEIELVSLSQIPQLISVGEIRHSLVVCGFFHLLQLAGGWRRPNLGKTIHR